MLIEKGINLNDFHLKYKDFYWDYNEFKSHVKDVVDWLKGNKVEHKTVALLENCNFYSFLLSVALNECNCIIMFMDLKSGSFVLEKMISHYQPDFVLYNTKECGELGSTFLKTTNKSCVFEENEYNLKKTSYQNTFNYTLLRLYPNSFIFFTSGTSSIPKAVLRSEACVFADAEHNITSFSISAKDTVVFAMPFGHVYGFGSGVIPFFLAGADIVFLESAVTGKALGKTIQDHNANVFIGNPLHYQALMTSWKEVLNLRFALSAGSPLPEIINQKFIDKFNIMINNMYGSSETGAITTLVNNEIEGSMKSCGEPLKGVQVRCACTQKNGEVAEIYVKSRALAEGYLDYEQGKILPIVNEDGWYETSDLGWVDDRGNVYISCRNSDIINVLGKKVSPRLIEDIVYSFDASLQVVVTAEKDINYNQFVVMYVTSKEFCKKDLLDYLKENLPLIFVPKKLYYIAEFPRTNNGKIARRKLEDKSILNKRELL